MNYQQQLSDLEMRLAKGLIDEDTYEETRQEILSESRLAYLNENEGGIDE